MVCCYYYNCGSFKRFSAKEADNKDDQRQSKLVRGEEGDTLPVTGPICCQQQLDSQTGEC